MSEKIIEQDAISMYESDMTKYSIIVNRRRAVPMIQDGLKPVHRRIIYGAYSLNLIGKHNDKSSAIVGAVMAKYHPHGDSSIYDATVCLANWFKTKYPLMQASGNYGSISGAGAAAMRYTHASLSQFGYDVLTEELSQSENIVDWVETYKRKGDKEPVFLPAKVPLLLINGSFGIGLGMTINVPSHNIVEVLEVTRKLLKNPDAKFCLIPDLPQACELIDCNWQSINDIGNGSFKVRGKIEQEVDKKGNIILHIVSLPDMTSTTDVYEKILDMIEKKELTMIKDIYNTVDHGKPNIIIHLKPGVDPEYVKQIIWTKTQVMQTESVNFEAVCMNGIDIHRFSYREYLLAFIDQRMNTKFRLYCNKLQKVMTRYHQIDAYIKVMESGKIDTIINMIRKQKTDDKNIIIEYIIKNCGTTDIQAKFICETQLYNLNIAKLKGYKIERGDLDFNIKKYMAMVSDDGTLIKQEIDNELLEIEKKYGDKRLCTIIDSSAQNSIPKGIFKIVITENNFIRKIPDIDKINIIKKDNPKFILRIDNTENIILFDNKGKSYLLPIHKIPVTDKSGQGSDIRILIKNLTADIINAYPELLFKQISECGNKHYLVVATKNNLIKKLDIEDFLNITPSGLVYTKLSSDDEVIGLSFVEHSLDIVVGSKHKSLRLNMKNIPLLKRAATGSKIMDTEEPLCGMGVLYPDSSDIIVITKNGKFNRFSSVMLTAHKRGSKGQNVIKLDSTDEIFAILGANENDNIRIVTADGIETIPVNSIKSKSALAPGTRMLSVNTIIIKAEITK